MNPDQKKIFDDLIREMEMSIEDNREIPHELKRRFVDELEKLPGSDEVIDEFLDKFGEIEDDESSSRFSSDEKGPAYDRKEFGVFVKFFNLKINFTYKTETPVRYPAPDSEQPES